MVKERAGRKRKGELEEGKEGRALPTNFLLIF